jgi:glycine/D-amino acid oxidase-like deaminating enzyme
MANYQHLSLWWDELPAQTTPRAPLVGDVEADVAIVGGGFTGLWTARSLIVNDPSLRVVVVEKDVCGFGASGRNGGWASALFAASDAKLARLHGLDAARAMRAAMNSAIEEVRVASEMDGIDCHFAKGGTVVAARSQAQVDRCHDEIAEARALGFGDDEITWLDAGAAQERLGAEGVLGATYTPHCAALQPALLVRGLAEAVEQRGATIFENTPATVITPAQGGKKASVDTPAGTIHADVVVRATEGWTSQFKESKRAVIPVYSLMIATEPLSDAQLERVRLTKRETFADHRHMIIYGQRTADGRIAFGGRGAPYHYGSSIKPSFDRDPEVFEKLRDSLVDLFPFLSATKITHRWGGPLGIPRDWYSSVGLDRSTGLAWAGGYVGDGVTTTNLAGRTLADLILGNDTELTHLPWVDHRSPNWEPEPLRWLGVNLGLAATGWSDTSEERNGKPSWVASKMTRLLGG